ncbi:MAG: hypothetical protein WC196_02715 [Bacilli bacterium]
MNCPICDKVIEQVDGKRAKKYCSQTCKQAFYRKSKDSAILAQKQGLENAPESATIDDNVTIDNVTPHIVTSNRNKDAAGNDNPTDYEYRRTSQLEHVRLAKGGGTIQQENMSKLHLVYQMLKGPKLQNYLGLDLTPEQLEKQGYYWPYWLTENTASRDRDKEGRVKVA